MDGSTDRCSHPPPRLKPDFIEMYTDFFTEARIREFTEFYYTPTGQRPEELTP